MSKFCNKNATQLDGKYCGIAYSWLQSETWYTLKRRIKEVFEKRSHTPLFQGSLDKKFLLNLPFVLQLQMCCLCKLLLPPTSLLQLRDPSRLCKNSTLRYYKNMNELLQDWGWQEHIPATADMSLTSKHLSSSILIISHLSGTCEADTSTQLDLRHWTSLARTWQLWEMQM